MKVALMHVRKPKIGLLPVTLKAFWELYPELEGKTNEALGTVTAELEKRFDVFHAEVVGDTREAREAGKVLSREDLDMLVVWGNGYVTSNIPEAATRQLADVPLVLLSTQRDDGVPRGMDYVRYWENSGLTGMIELGGALAKSGVSFHNVVGLHDEPRIYQKMEDLAEACRVKNRLKQLNIAVVGYPYPGMLDIVVDERATNALGASVVHIAFPEIARRVKEMPDDRVHAFLESSRGDYDASGVHVDDLFRAARFYCVLEDLVRDYEVNAFCLHDFECVSSATETLSEFGLSMAEKRLGIAAGCEGDLPNTISAFLLRELAGSSPMFADWAMFDEPRNAVYFVHNGKADPDIVLKPTLCPTAEPFGILGEGAVFEVSGKPGPVTMASMILGQKGWRLFASEGEAIQAEPEPCRQNQMTVKVDRPVREYLEAVGNLGITHHVNLVHGHVAGRLAHLCGLLGIEYLGL